MANYSKISLFFRSLIVFIYSVITIPPYSFVCMLSLPFPLSYRHVLIRSYLRVYLHILKFVCHINYKVEGLENIPKNRTGIILSKHQSTWETFFLPTILTSSKSRV